MKISVKVDGKDFDVEIIDPLARPVVAYVEGERFEVWPGEGSGKPLSGPGPAEFPGVEKPKNGNGNGNGNGKKAEPAIASHPVGYAKRNGNGHDGLKWINAPIPGTIRSVDVSPGDQVRPGQQVCVLEAMKMYNSIRATRAGVVAAVNVEPGKHVGRNEVLVVVGD